MNYEKINKFDSANGPGIRTSLFVCGCPIHCPGCFNKELQDFDYGQKFDKEAEEKILEYLSHPHVRGFTLLGGEPFAPPNQLKNYFLLSKIKNRYPNKDIWCFTGYRLDEELKKFIQFPPDFGYHCGYPGFPDYNENIVSKTNPAVLLMLKRIDVLVDGPFIEELKNPGLRFRGSSNQRIIDVQETLKQGEIVLSEYN